MTTTDPFQQITSVIGGTMNGNGTHPDTPNAESWEPLNLVTLNAAPPPKPNLVHGPSGALLYQGVPHLISGEPESLKSWVALLAAVQTIHDGHKVIWIDADGAGPGDTLERLRALGLTDEQISSGFGYINPDSATTRDHIQAIADEWRPELVVIDALNPAMTLLGLDPMSETDVERFRRVMLGCWGTATELMLDHVAKDKEKRGGYSIGSQRKQALVRVHIQMEVTQRLSRETTGVARIIASKDRPGWHHRGPDGRVGELTLTPVGDGRIEYRMDLHGRTATKEVFRPTTLMEKVSRYMETQGGAVTTNQITEHVEGRRDTIIRAIQTLIDESYCTVTKGTRNANVHTAVRPYRKAHDPLSEAEN